MTISPELKFDALVGKLNKIVDSDNPNVFVMKQLEKDAQVLAKTDAHASFIAQGIISCIKNDAAGVRKYHEKSLRLRNDIFTKLQYAYSLTNVSQYVDALNIFEEVFKIEKDDLVVLGRMIDDAVYTLSFFRARELINIWEKMHHNGSHDDSEMVNDVIDFLERFDITDQDMIFAQRALSKVLEKGYRTKARKFTIMNDEEYNWLDIDLTVKGDANEIFKLNCDMADEMIENDASSKVLERTVVRFSEFTNVV